MGFQKQLQTIVQKLVDKHVNDESKSGPSFVNEFCRMPFKTRSIMTDHLVLLVSALVPKALASLLTSCLITSDQWINVSLQLVIM